MDEREQLLAGLERAVARAAAFFSVMDEDLFDGYQTARDVLSHLLFWHREYVLIARALVNGRRPPLRTGSFAMLNAQATEEFSRMDWPDMVECLQTLQEELDAVLCCLPEWQMNFPVKKGSRFCNTAQRISKIESHILGHVARLERAARRGEAWVKAYYMEAT
jgi:hypothetical protein